MTAEELKQIFGRAVPDRGEAPGDPPAGGEAGAGLYGRPGIHGGPGGASGAGCRPVPGPGRSGADPGDPGDLSRHSLYAFEDEIRQGFLTIEGGHRVGIAGKAVTEGSRLRTIRDISSLNIRLAHEKPGCGIRCSPWL